MVKKQKESIESKTQRIIETLRSIDDKFELCKGEIIIFLYELDTVEDTNYQGLLSRLIEDSQNKLKDSLKEYTLNLLDFVNLYKIAKEIKVSIEGYIKKLKNSKDANKLKNLYDLIKEGDDKSNKCFNEANYLSGITVRLESGDQDAWKELYNHLTRI
jgi:hypothetical protein